MSKKRSTYNRRAGTPSLIAGLTLALIAAVVALFVSYNSSKGETQKPTANNNSNSSPQTLISSSESGEEIKPKPVEREGLEVRYLDVGQGDCTLILLPDGKNVLIDAGPNSSAEYVVDYLKNAGVEKIDFLIATHPHEDHIGGMDEVINNFEIGRIYAPKIEQSEDSSVNSDTESSQSAAVTTKTYENFLKAVSDKGLKIINGKGGTHVYFSLSLTIDLVAPNNDEYSDLNNYSIVVQMKYGQHSFLFMGDAENYSEQEILEGGYDLKSDIIKIGHHGSSSSSSKAFVQKVNPRYAVISCSADNKYGHPHAETLKTLEENEVKVFRTDLNGVITVKSDGLNDFVVNAEKEDVAEASNKPNSELSDTSESSVGDNGEASKTEKSDESNSEESTSENSNDAQAVTESLAA